MNEKDKTQKTLEQYNDIFADILNVLLFGGKRLIDPEELTEATTFSQYKLGSSIRGQDRDVAKYWKNGRIRIALVGLENQTDPNPDMPLRVIGYDGAAYRGQLNKDKNGTTPKERYPVVTLVLYFGHKTRWKRNRSLKQRLKIPKELDPYVSDYELNIFEIAFLERETIDQFQSDFWILADYCYQMRAAGEYIPPHKGMKHPEEVADALSAFSKDPRFQEMYEIISVGKEGNNMPIDSWFDQAEARGQARGEEIGEKIGARKERDRAEKEKLESARRFKADGVSNEVIARNMDLPLELIQSL